MSKANVEFKEGVLVAGVDMNEDGENMISLKVNMKEAMEEAFAKLKKGESSSVVLDVKKVELKFDMSGMKLLVDTNQDGEAAIELEVSLTETVDEVGSIFKKEEK